jgi:type I restriction enzyme, S subunit
MQNNWKKEKLKNIAEVIMGQSPKSEFYNDSGEGLPFFQGRAEFRSLYPVVQKWCTKPTKVARANDVLMTVRAPVGDLNIAKEECIIGRGICAIRSKIENDRFLFYLLKANNSYITSFGSGAVYDAINKDLVEALTFLLPNESLQKTISFILSAFDDLIENNARRIQIFEEIGQRIYQEWFVDFRFPGHKKIKFVDSDIGGIPENWIVGRLGDIIDCSNESTQAGEHLSDRKYVPIDCIPRKSLALLDAKPWSDAKSSLKLFQKGDILFGAMRPYFHKVAIAPFDGVTRTTCFVLRAKDPKYFSYSLMTLFRDETIAFATANSQGATIPYAVWNNSMENMPILIPPVDLAQEFEDCINPLLGHIQGSFDKQVRLNETRDILLPRLISGEIDVSGLDIELKEEENVS